VLEGSTPATAHLGVRAMAAAVVLSFLIAGLLYLLCFEHFDNLRAYSIPSKTGLLISPVKDYFLGKL
jgi:hypothetical protein